MNLAPPPRAGILLIFLLLLALTACELASQTPQMIVVTATPEPADAGPPLPTVPTWTPEPTWTPQPTPTPTATPFPTPTPNLQELGMIKVQSCSSELNRHRGGQNPPLPFFQFVDAVSDESGSALGKFRVPDGEYGYQSWLPGPVYGTGKCAGASYAGWLTPTPDSRGGEHRIQQVAAIAKEACNEPRAEFRPATETFALGYYQGGFRPRFGTFTTVYYWYIYDAITNRCVSVNSYSREGLPIADLALAEYAQQAWSAWPEILPTPTPEAPPTPIPTATAAPPAEAAPTIPPTAAP